MHLAHINGRLHDDTGKAISAADVDNRTVILDADGNELDWRRHADGTLTVTESRAASAPAPAAKRSLWPWGGRR